MAGKRQLLVQARALFNERRDVLKLLLESRAQQALAGRQVR